MNVLFWTGFVITKIIIFLCRGKVDGRQNLPKTGPYIMASNHISYFDPPFVASTTGREMYFFAKKELFNNKLFGALLTKLNAKPVRRGICDRGAIESAVQILESGNRLVVFPEGTRSLTDNFLSPKPGVGLIARQAKIPIVPVYISGSNTLWKSLLGSAKLRISIGEPLTSEYISSFVPEKESYKVITEEIMMRIKALKEKTLS